MPVLIEGKQRLCGVLWMGKEDPSTPVMACTVVVVADSHPRYQSQAGLRMYGLNGETVAQRK
jgi:hypothetical protein